MLNFVVALTDHCDVFGSVNIKAFNNGVRHLQQQRPSLFNYGTISFVRHTELLYTQAIIHAIDRDVGIFGNLIVTERPLLSIPGYTGPSGFEHCFQLSEFSIDFHSSNVHAIPPELNPPLQPQRLSLKARACAGLACPGLNRALQRNRREDLNCCVLKRVPVVLIRLSITHLRRPRA